MQSKRGEPRCWLKTTQMCRHFVALSSPEYCHESSLLASLRNYEISKQLEVDRTIIKLSLIWPMTKYLRRVRGRTIIAARRWPKWKNLINSNNFLRAWMDKTILKAANQKGLNVSWPKAFRFHVSSRCRVGAIFSLLAWLDFPFKEVCCKGKLIVD
jgi:hypothetical protein